MKKFTKVSVTVVAVSSALILIGPLTAFAATAPDLGVADPFSLWGKSGVGNTGAGTHAWGNVGADLLSNITGLIASQVDGTMQGPVTNLQTDATAAYGALNGWTPSGTKNLSTPQTVTPGVYTVDATQTFTGTTILDGAGVYIFQGNGAYTFANGATMSLINGATACNVFWAIPGIMTIGTTAHVEGTIITNSGNIILQTGANLVGRALSLIASVSLDTNQITAPCAAVVVSVGSVQNGTIKVVKKVINDNGGTNVVSDFPLFVNGQNVGHQSVTSGGTNVFPTNGLYPYAVTETSNPNYTATFSGDCNANGFLNLAPGDHKTCIITNNDKGAPVVPPALPATITVVKKVINNNGGTRTVASFPLSVNGAQVVSGVINIFPVGTYTVNEIGASNYTRTFSGDCDKNGVMNLVAGNNKTCTITNTYQTQTVTTTTTTTTTVPKLPNTGLPLQSRTPWDIFITAGILMLVSVSIVLALKKRAV